jgi:hypothetical protein
VKRTLVCLVVVLISFAAAQELPRTVEKVNALRLFRFSGTLPAAKGALPAAGLTLHFSIYTHPSGGRPFWQESHTVRPDPQGRYTVLLGDATSGGLPANLLVADREYWLGVKAPGQPEQPRGRWVELPSALRSDAFRATLSVSEGHHEN